MSVEREGRDYSQERIESGVYRSGILAPFENVVGAGMSTKELLGKSRVTGDRDRFDKPFEKQDAEERLKKISAGRVLARLLQRIAPEADPRNIVKTALVHGDQTVHVTSEYLERDRKDLARVEADGLITNIPGVPLMVAAADCAPVGVYDDERKAIGLFHSGWRGTLKGVVPKGVAEMKKQFGSDVHSLRVFVGPYGGHTQYEVGQDVYDQFRDVQSESGDPLYTYEELQKIFNSNPKDVSKYFFDNGLAVKIALAKSGIPEDQIEVSEHSTIEENDLFSSERAEGHADRDTNVALMALRSGEQHRIIEGKKYRLLETGVFGAPINERLFTKGWNYFTDLEQSPTLSAAHEKIVNEAKGRTPEEVLKLIKNEIQNIFKTTEKGAVLKYDRSRRKNRSTPLPLESFAADGYGNCSHMTVAFALIAERLREDGILTGRVSVEDAYWENEFAAGGHVWALYESPDGGRIIVDGAQDFIGSESEYAALLEGVKWAELSNF